MSGWNLIESDAAVFTSLVEQLGVEDIQFEELYSIDEETLKSFGKLYGVIFLFKYTSKDQSSEPVCGRYLTREDYSTEKEFNDVFFAAQTIQNACATQAVLNVLLNKDDVELGNELTSFKEFVGSFDPVMKGETIGNSENIRVVHNSFSSPNRFIDESSHDNDIDDAEVYHFVGYIWKNGKILEFDGLKRDPIYHGDCKEDEFYGKLVNVLNERISKYELNELRFSLLAIIRDLRLYYSEIEDYESLEKEVLKREKWDKENDLRRADLIGLVHDVTKALIKLQGEEKWKETLNKASSKGFTRILANRLKR